MNAQEMLDYAKRYRQLWAEHDLDALLELHHPDCELHVLGTEPVRGLDAIRQAFASLFDQFPDLYFEGRALHAGGRHFVSEWTVSGTPSESDIAVFGLTGQSDRSMQCLGTDIFTVEDGLITSKHSYYDTLEIAKQLGIVLDRNSEPVTG
jgi:ketosteroid isomerase-like protein